LNWTSWMLRNKLLTISIAVLLFVAITAVFSPYVAPHDPAHVDLFHKFQPPSREFPLGTDHLGRCILSRLIYGGAISLGSASVIILFTLLIGIMVGTIAGYAGGPLDHLLMRLCDVSLAFPTLISALALISVWGAGLTTTVLAIVLARWAAYARIVRGMVIALKKKEFIGAARLSGTNGFFMIWRHLLPNVLPEVVVLAALDMGNVILFMSGLSFLGLGVQPPMVEWGIMINDSKPFLTGHPSLMLYPGAMIVIMVMSFHQLGEALRDHLDPNLK
jgi:ABC-type dipeptide/oligopeptide/nickel transport system permease subunit